MPSEALSGPYSVEYGPVVATCALNSTLSLGIGIATVPVSVVPVSAPKAQPLKALVPVRS